MHDCKYFKWVDGQAYNYPPNDSIQSVRVVEEHGATTRQNRLYQQPTSMNDIMKIKTENFVLKVVLGVVVLVVLLVVFVVQFVTLLVKL